MKYVVALLLAVVTVVPFTGCKKSDILPYESKNKLWFTAVDPQNKNIRINDIVRSFSHYPGKEKLEIGFPVNVIGPIPQSDISYSVVVVDSLTTAAAGEYELQSRTVRGGYTTDTLFVTLVKSPRMDSKEVVLALCIVEDENFGPGYSDRIQAKVAFNNITTQPEWWNEEMTLIYFGPYSPWKFENFCAFSGRFEIAGLSPSQLRRLLLDFKKHIKDNGITEKNGDPMIIPIY